MKHKIMTVNGEIFPEELGYCQCHEHILLKKGVSFLQNPDLCIDDLKKSTEEVSRYAKAGGISLIDAQPGGCCRMEKGLSLISSETGVNIIASTGFHKLCFYPALHWIHTFSEEQMYQFILHELTAGMFSDADSRIPSESSSHLAGIIKCAYDIAGLSSSYLRLFSAAARASVSTDVPLMVHIEPGSSPRELLDFLFQAGVKPKRILLCHLDRSILPLEDYITLLKTGVYLEFDTIGRPKYHDDFSEAACICRLTEQGYGSQLLLSLDTTRARLKSYTPGGVGLDYLLDSFLPMLKNYGLSDSEIHQMTVANCRNVFAA